MAQRKRAAGQPEQRDWTRYRPGGSLTLVALITATLLAWIGLLIWLAL